jgi:hypothetical protein
MEQKENDKAKEKARVGVKLGYFAREYVRTGVFEETVDLPGVRFSYKPLTMIQTAALTTAVLGTESVEESTDSNLRMAIAHLVEWDLVKRNKQYTKGSTEGPEFADEFVVIDFKEIAELRLVSPLIMNHILSTIRGDLCNPFLEKGALDDQVKNS